jgi:hypothetical protein
MNIDVDAAALGMSNSVVVHTADVNSAYWNPAGLVYLEGNQLALIHSSHFANIANYNYVAFAMPIDDRSTMAVSIIRFGVDDILDTTQLIDDQGNVNYDEKIYCCRSRNPFFLCKKTSSCWIELWCEC